MAVKDIYKKIEKIASDEPLSHKKGYLWRKENKYWLDKSFDIALAILDALDAKGWTQKKLAKELEVTEQQVSKIVKGKENLTLSTISKIEQALDIELINVYEPFKESLIILHQEPSEKLEFNLDEIYEGFACVNLITPKFKKHRQKSVLLGSFKIRQPEKSIAPLKYA